MNDTKERVPDITENSKLIPEQYRESSEDVPETNTESGQNSVHIPDSHKRVAVYERLPALDSDTDESNESLDDHYQNLFKENPDWELVDYYIDKGVSGSSVKNRDSFIRMIDDCRAGKIDLIVVKNISRFSRNVCDFLSYVRQLKENNPPVGVFFEDESFYSLDDNSENILSLMATVNAERKYKKLRKDLLK